MEIYHLLELLSTEKVLQNIMLQCMNECNESLVKYILINIVMSCVICT